MKYLTKKFFFLKHKNEVNLLKLFIWLDKFFWKPLNTNIDYNSNDIWIKSRKTTVCVCVCVCVREREQGREGEERRF